MILVALAVRGFVDDLSLQLYYNTFWFAIGRMLLATINDGHSYLLHHKKSIIPDEKMKLFIEFRRFSIFACSRSAC